MNIVDMQMVSIIVHPRSAIALGPRSKTVDRSGKMLPISYAHSVTGFNRFSPDFPLGLIQAILVSKRGRNALGISI